MVDYYFSRVVRCNNPDAIKELVLAIRKEDVEQCEEWKYGDKSVILLSMEDYNLFEEKTKQVSKNFPEEVFDCEENSEYCPSYGYTSEFRNGEFKELGVQAVYNFRPMHLGSEKDEDGIYKKATALFRRLDKLVPNPDGSMRIDWIEEEICYRFSYDGVDGTKYRVEATKTKGFYVSLKVFKYIRRKGWIEIISLEEFIRNCMAMPSG